MHDHQPGTIGEAESRADVPQQNDRDPDFKTELVGGETGRVNGVKVKMWPYVSSATLSAEK